MSSDTAKPLSQTQIVETGRLAELGLHAAELVHELRQPLFAAKSLAQLLAIELQGDAVDLDRVREQLAVVYDQLAQLDALLQRYGGAGRRFDGQLVPILLAPPVTAAVQMFVARAEGAGLVLDLELYAADLRVLGDTVAVQQIFGNLIQNALDAATNRVLVRLHGRRVEVLDDGPPWTDDVPSRVFEPFYTTKPPGKGTGLGLSVAQHLMHAFGGELHMQRLDGHTVMVATFQPTEGDGDGNRS